MKIIKYMTYSVLAVILSGVGYMMITGQNTNEVGLKVLSMVKRIKGDAVSVKRLKRDNTPLPDHTIWTGLLEQFVTPDGIVNYSGIVAEQDSLQQYLDILSAHPPGSNWSEGDQLAYWINAYNAFTVKLIVDHYPVNSIKDIASGLPMISSPWDIKFFKIGGVDMDLNTIEHQILRKQFDDFRIHFAINCASVSCPRLRNEAFVAEQLESQLQDQESYFITNDVKNKVEDDSVELSPIFSWFQTDFTKKTSIIDLVNKHHDANEITEFSYLDYDWSLNE